MVPKVNAFVFAYQRGCVDCTVYGNSEWKLSFMLMLSGVKLPLVCAVRHRCTGPVCCHIEAVIRWCLTEEQAWEDGDASFRWVMDGLLVCGGFLCICCVPGDGL